MRLSDGSQVIIDHISFFNHLAPKSGPVTSIDEVTPGELLLYFTISNDEDPVVVLLLGVEGHEHGSYLRVLV